MNIDNDGQIQLHIAARHDWLDRFRDEIAKQIVGFTELRQKLIDAGEGNSQNLEFANGILTRLTGWYIADLNNTGDFGLHQELLDKRDLSREFLDECDKLENALKRIGVE